MKSLFFALLSAMAVYLAAFTPFVALAAILVAAVALVIWFSGPGGKFGRNLAVLGMIALVFLLVAGQRLKADSGVPKCVTYTTDADGVEIRTSGTNGVYLDGLILGPTAPATGGVDTYRLYDLAATGLTTSASLVLKMDLTRTATTSTYLLPPCGIFFSHGIRFVNANSTTITATFLDSRR